MATTTNYAWETPDDTDLVKDGAAAIRTLGSSVDTTTKALNPSTTLGDIEYRSATANTNTRLGIGNTGNVLTVSGGVPVWSAPASGSLTLLSTTSLSGASVTVSSISQSYKNLYVEVFGCTGDDSIGTYNVEFNGSTTGMNRIIITETTVSNNPDSALTFGQNNVINKTSANNFWSFEIQNYASTTTYKSFISQGVYLKTSAGSVGQLFVGGYSSNSAITSLKISTYGNLSTGTLRIYGVN